MAHVHMRKATPLYYFQVGERQPHEPGAFLGLKGELVADCLDISQLMIFYSVHEAHSFHARMRGLMNGSILRLRWTVL
jgi:hypothetical protein